MLLVSACSPPPKSQSWYADWCGASYPRDGIKYDTAFAVDQLVLIGLDHHGDIGFADPEAEPDCLVSFSKFAVDEWKSINAMWREADHLSSSADRRLFGVRIVGTATWIKERGDTLLKLTSVSNYEIVEVPKPASEIFQDDRDS